MIGICKSYICRSRENISVPSDFNLGIRAGESVCLSGPSGIGKSTVARIILGVEAPDAGRFSGRIDLCAMPGNGLTASFFAGSRWSGRIPLFTSILFYR